MAAGTASPTFVTLILFSLILMTTGQVLTPPTFNLAKGRAITASATCGYEDAEPGPGFVELYCRLTGATGTNQDDIREIIQVGAVFFCQKSNVEYRGSCMSAHVLLNYKPSWGKR